MSPLFACRLLAPLLTRAAQRGQFALPCHRTLVIVERWWQVPLAKLGKPPRLTSRHRIYRFVEDTKTRPKDLLELILTRRVPGYGHRGEVVRVSKPFGRNKLLATGQAVYASPENLRLFQEEKLNPATAKEDTTQTWTALQTMEHLKSSRFEVQIKADAEWQLTEEIVRRRFERNLGVFVASHALKLPDEPITRFGEYWCEVTFNGLDTVRVPMHVVPFVPPSEQGQRD
ncbi:large ribosomal subunit protein bL9m [Lampetra fluviatilis]